MQLRLLLLFAFSSMAFGQSQLGGYTASSSVPTPAVFGQGLVSNGTTLVPTYGTSAAYYPGLVLFGDSNTTGFGSSTYTAPPPTPSTINWDGGFAYLMQPDFGPSSGFFNYAVSGDQIADQVNNQLLPHLNPQTSRNPTVVAMLGTNDARKYGATTGGYNNFQYALQTLIVDAALPLSNKVLASNMTKTGTWAANATFNGGTTQYSSTVNSTISGTVTTTSASQPIFVSWGAGDTGTGPATVSIDGTVVDTISSTGFNGVALATFNAPTTAHSYFTKAYVPATGAGSHTVLMTVQTAGQAFEMMMLSTPAPDLNIGYPRLFVGGVLKQQADAISATTAAYDALAKSTVATFAGYGIPVQFLDVRSVINLATDYFDTFHINDVGHKKIANLFESIIQPIVAPVPNALNTQNTANNNTAGFGTMTGGTFTYTFSPALASAPTCVANDYVAANPVKVAATTTALTLTGTSGDGAVYICVLRQ